MNYRHAFHAGNHADALKHTLLLALCDALTAKPAPLFALDTHAGAGLYRLDGDYAQTSGEARHGFLQLLGPSASATSAHAQKVPSDQSGKALAAINVIVLGCIYHVLYNCGI
jgi:23S rRNA A2030 N6-methylase RlmJ